MIDPGLLLGFPISIFSNYGYDKIKELKAYMADSESYERLLLNSFYKAIRLHKEHYDAYASSILNELQEKVKNDERTFLSLFNREENTFISSTDREAFFVRITQGLVEAYPCTHTQDNQLYKQIIQDCFKYYQIAFITLMTEKEGIEVLLKNSWQITSIRELLNQINKEIITREEFKELRKVIYQAHLQKDPDYTKTMADYDNYIAIKFKYLELNGFSPKVSGREVQMELSDIFVASEICRQTELLPDIRQEKPIILRKPVKVRPSSIIRRLSYWEIPVPGNPPC